MEIHLSNIVSENELRLRLKEFFTSPTSLTFLVVVFDTRACKKQRLQHFKFLYDRAAADYRVQNNPAPKHVIVICYLPRPQSASINANNEKTKIDKGNRSSSVIIQTKETNDEEVFQMDHDYAWRHAFLDEIVPGKPEGIPEIHSMLNISLWNFLRDPSVQGSLFPAIIQR
jgi:hypothetical protein